MAEIGPTNINPVANTNPRPAPRIDRGADNARGLNEQRQAQNNSPLNEQRQTQNNSPLNNQQLRPVTQPGVNTENNPQTQTTGENNIGPTNIQPREVVDVQSLNQNNQPQVNTSAATENRGAISQGDEAVLRGRNTGVDQEVGQVNVATENPAVRGVERTETAQVERIQTNNAANANSGPAQAVAAARAFTPEGQLGGRVNLVV